MQTTYYHTNESFRVMRLVLSTLSVVLCADGRASPTRVQLVRRQNIPTLSASDWSAVKVDIGVDSQKSLRHRFDS